MASAEPRQSARQSSRKRARQPQGQDDGLQQFLELAMRSEKMVIFTGSGISANSGMSMFSTRNGLYDRARKRFKITDGIKLFSYPFYKQRKADVQAFFAEIYSEAQASRASPGHHALSMLNAMGRLQRHYTLNIDGLAEVVGLDTWHHEFNPNGSTVEMHGNIRDIVCPECHATEPLTRTSVNTMKQSRPVMCSNCPDGEMRFKVMLYDDEQGDCITPEDVFEQLEEDLRHADIVVWMGISFEQSASTEYFRKVRYFLASLGRSQQVRQVIINPSDEALFNVMSSLANREDVQVLEVLERSDDVLPLLTDRLRAAYPQQAEEAAAVAAVAAAAAVERRSLQLRRSRSPPAQQQQQQQDAKPPPLWVQAGAADGQGQQAVKAEDSTASVHPLAPKQQHQQQGKEEEKQKQGLVAKGSGSTVTWPLGGPVLAATAQLLAPAMLSVLQQPGPPLFQEHKPVLQQMQQQRLQQQQHNCQQHPRAMPLLEQEQLQHALAMLSTPASAPDPSLAAAAAALAAASTSSEHAGVASWQLPGVSGHMAARAPHKHASNGATVGMSQHGVGTAQLVASPAKAQRQQKSVQTTAALLNASNGTDPVAGSSSPIAAAKADAGVASALALLMQAMGPQVAAMVAAAAAGP